MPEKWNFHSYISVPLEKYSKVHLGEDYRSADEIDCGQFVDTMLQILNVVYGSLSEVAEFVDCCRAYASASRLEIPQEVAKDLFYDFERLLHNKCK